jgi:hypothetical protein
MASQESKTEQRTKLFIKLGQLLAGLREMAARATPPTTPEYRIAAAKFSPDYHAWANDVRTFGTFPPIVFDREIGDINRPMDSVLGVLFSLSASTADDRDRQKTLTQNLDGYERETITAINSIPIEWEARLHAERTPLSTSLAIKDAMRMAQRRMDYFDRYTNSDFFELYVRDLRRDIEIRLVTTPGSAKYGVQNISALSRLIGALLPWIDWPHRFSLRTLLIATTLVAVVLGTIVWLSH